MQPFDEALKFTLGLEGPRSNDPNDPGGETLYGIAKNKHPEMWKDGPPTYEAAKSFYKREFWDLLSLDAIASVSAPVALELFDSSVNCGQDNAGLWLQRALNAFNLRGAHYPDVKVDGKVGPATATAFNSFMRHRGAEGEKVMLRALNNLQGAYYILIAEKNQRLEDYEFGWFANRIS